MPSLWTQAGSVLRKKQPRIVSTVRENNMHADACTVHCTCTAHYVQHPRVEVGSGRVGAENSITCTAQGRTYLQRFHWSVGGILKRFAHKSSNACDTPHPEGKGSALPRASFFRKRTNCTVAHPAFPILQWIHQSSTQSW